MKFVPYKAMYGYCENGQSVSVRMAFCNKQEDETYVQMFLPVICRDYFSDILHSEFHQIKVNDIFGFSYDPAKQKIDRDKVRLSLQCESETQFNNIKANVLPLLNPIEDMNGFTRSELYFPEDSKVMIMEGDPKWLASTYLLAAYTPKLQNSIVGDCQLKQATNLYKLAVLLTAR